MKQRSKSLILGTAIGDLISFEKAVFAFFLLPPGQKEGATRHERLKRKQIDHSKAAKLIYVIKRDVEGAIPYKQAIYVAYNKREGTEALPYKL